MSGADATAAASAPVTPPRPLTLHRPLTLLGPAGVVCEGDFCEIPDQAFGVSGSEMSATTAP